MEVAGITSKTYVEFTEEEKVSLLAARDKIVNWIRGNIIPKMYGLMEIRVDFEYRNTYGCLHRNQLLVYASNRDFHNPNSIPSHFATFVTYDDGINGERDFVAIEEADFLYSVIKSWDIIKSHLLKEVQKREDISESIRDFSI